MRDPSPRFLIDQLAEQVCGKAQDDLVFAGVRGGGVLRAPILRRAAFDRAAEAIGMSGLHPHCRLDTHEPSICATFLSLAERAYESLRYGERRTSTNITADDTSASRRSPVGAPCSGIGSQVPRQHASVWHATEQVAEASVPKG